MTNCFGLSGSSNVGASISRCLEQNMRLNSTEKAEKVLHGFRRAAFFLRYKIKFTFSSFKTQFRARFFLNVCNESNSRIFCAPLRPLIIKR